MKGVLSQLNKIFLWK